MDLDVSLREFLEQKENETKELQEGVKELETMVQQLHDVVVANYSLISGVFYQFLSMMELDVPEDTLYNLADDLCHNYCTMSNVKKGVMPVARDLKHIKWEDLIVLNDEIKEIVTEETKFWENTHEISENDLKTEISDAIEETFFFENSYLYVMLEDFSYIIAKVA